MLSLVKHRAGATLLELAEPGFTPRLTEDSHLGSPNPCLLIAHMKTEVLHWISLTL